MMKSRFFNVIIVLFIAGLFTSSAATGGRDLSFPKIKGWKLDVSSKVYTPDNLWDLINGAAESYLSYDFQDLHLADYRSKSGMEIHAEIYRHSSNNNAFGIYSSERSSDYNFIQTGTQGYQDEGILNFFIGEFYIKLYSTGEGDQLEESLALIGDAISGHLDRDESWPEPLSLFPPKGKIPNTENYIRENFIGLNFLHSAFTAEYEGDYRLFVILGKDREEILEMVRAYLKFTKQDTDPEEVSEFTIKDKYNGDIPVVLKDAALCGIIDGSENDGAREGLMRMAANLSSEK